MQNLHNSPRHCEERSDVAISKTTGYKKVCCKMQNFATDPF